MSARSFRAALGIVLLTFAVLVGVSIYAVNEVVHYPEKRHAGAGREVTIEITRGMRFPEVASALAAERVIDRPTWFRVYAMHRGHANKVRAGKYVLRDDLSPKDLLDTLVRGVDELDVPVTIPEGKHLREVFSLVEAAGIAKAAELEKLGRDKKWLSAQGIEADTVEGYLFPDTYRFKRPTEPGAVLAAMVKQHRQVWGELARQHAAAVAQRKRELGWNDRDLLVMASIVEKETGAPEERRRVASVFYNRLLAPNFPSRRLETDPTIRYGCTIPLLKSKACKKWDPSDRLHRAQLDDEDNPYNTYQHSGLPPGPISNPGRASIAAAMDPEETEYLFFVARDEKNHVFSKTFEEHNRWVDKYMR